MSSMIDLNQIIAAGLQRKAAQEAAARQVQNDIAISMLNGLITGLTTARTPQEARKSFQMFSKQFERATAGMPGGPFPLFNDLDLQNIERMIGRNNEITSKLADITVQNTGKILTGAMGFDEAYKNMNESLRSMAEQYGEAEVGGYKPAMFKELTDAMETRQRYATARINLQAALRPDVNALQRFVPEISPLIVNFEAGLDARAFQAMALRYFGEGLQPGAGSAMLNEKWLKDGAKALRLPGNPDNFSATDKSMAIETGRKAWDDEMATVRESIADTFYKNTIPSLMNVGEAQFNQLMRLSVQVANNAAGEDIFKYFPLDDRDVQKALDEAAAKYHTGATSDREAVAVTNITNALRLSGMLDQSGIGFKGMDENEWSQSVANGTVEGAMRQIAGPDGTSLWSLIFDKQGNMRPYASRVVDIMDLDKLAKGDRVAWDTAKYFASSTEPSEWLTKSPDGREDWTIYRALAYAREKDSNAIIERSQGRYVAPVDPGAFLSGIGPEVSGMMATRMASRAGETTAPIPSDEVLSALDEAAKEGLRTDPKVFQDFHDKLFGSTGLTSGAFEGILDNMISGFARQMKQGESVQRRVDELRSTMMNSVINSMPDQKKEEPGGTGKSMVEQQKQESGRQAEIQKQISALSVGTYNPLDDLRRQLNEDLGVRVRQTAGLG